MYIYLITHGECQEGPDPVHTPNGIEQLRAILVPQDLVRIIVGIGQRYTDILRVVQSKTPAVVVRYSPFLGGPEVIREKDRVVLTDGRMIDASEYIGMYYNPINLWPLIQRFPALTLLCSGNILMKALGFGTIYKPGRLFKIYPETQDCEMVAQ
ncbi:MAG: hypothetical protein WC845_04090 [Candidatus Staskawiczbacteria bacterium]|jgi:hypothetical protein